MQLAYLPCASCDHCLIKALVNELKDVNMNIFKKFTSHGYALNANAPDVNEPWLGIQNVEKSYSVIAQFGLSAHAYCQAEVLWMQYVFQLLQHNSLQHHASEYDAFYKHFSALQ